MLLRASRSSASQATASYTEHRHTMVLARSVNGTGTGQKDEQMERRDRQMDRQGVMHKWPPTGGLLIN